MIFSKASQRTAIFILLSFVLNQTAYPQSKSEVASPTAGNLKLGWEDNEYPGHVDVNAAWVAYEDSEPLEQQIAAFSAPADGDEEGEGEEGRKSEGTGEAEAKRANPDKPVKPVVILAAEDAASQKKAEKLKKQLAEKNISAKVFNVPVKKAKETLYDSTIGRAVKYFKEAYQSPTKLEVAIGAFSGAFRLATAGGTYFSVGMDPAAAASIVAIVTARTALRDAFIGTVDNIHDGKKANQPPAPKDAPPPTAKQAWLNKLRGIASRQTENLFFLELVRVISTLGGSERTLSPFTAMGQADILFNILSSGTTGAIQGTMRSQALATPKDATPEQAKKWGRVRAWWNFNAFAVGAVFQSLIWSGLGGPTVADLGMFKVSAALAGNMAFDILLGTALNKMPGLGVKVAELQDAAAEKLGSIIFRRKAAGTAAGDCVAQAAEAIQ